MDTFQRISPQQAHEIINAGSVAIVDVRDPGAFAQGHIDHAQMLDETNIDAFLKATKKDTPLICYCYHGISSQRAAHYFAQQGFQKVYSIDGGFEAWKNIYG